MGLHLDNLSKIVVAIDGPAGTGKSTAARLFSRQLGFTYIDSGAIYRSIAWLLIHRGESSAKLLDSEKEQSILKEFAQKMKVDNDTDGRMLVSFEGQDISRTIRSKEVEKVVPHVAQNGSVRSFVMDFLRKIAEGHDVVVEGRDIGTVVFPDAQVKFFMYASPLDRAQRRYLSLRGENVFQPLHECFEGIKLRDRLDTERAIAPLEPARDAIQIDTTALTISQVLQLMRKHFGTRYPSLVSHIADEYFELQPPGVLIAVSGLIGIGKTSLCSWLSEEFKIPVFAENPDENPFIFRSYENRDAWAFESQMWFLWRKHELLSAIKAQKTPAVIDRTLYEDYMFAKLLLKPDELHLYEHWYHLVRLAAPEPNLIISLEAQSLDTIYSRIRNRGRKYEISISSEFLKALQKEYNNWISTHSQCPIKRIDTELSDVTSPKVRSDLREFIAQSLLQVAAQ